MKKFLTPTLLVVSFISFCTDIATEMLYPVLPLYLASVGYGVVVIGALEGFSEAFSGLNKVFFGHISDQTGKRTLFMKIGYALSAISRPLIGATTSAWGIFGAKFADRIGKGIRTAPRDAIIVSESTPETRGRAFGFHRTLDTLGAVIGPAIGLLLLITHPGNYRALFFYAVIPGVIAIALTFMLKKEPKVATGAIKKRGPSLQAFKDFWKTSTPQYKKMIVGFTLFALLNSSNVFLILRAQELGLSDLWILGAYIVYNIVSAAAAFPLGVLGDRIGFKWTYIAGLFIFALSYGLFGFGLTATWAILGLFGIYGLFSAVNDGTANAWLSLHVPSEYKATGLGLHMTLSALAFFAASFITGVLWNKVGSALTFTIISIGTCIVMLYFMLLRFESK
jgi:MFS family permease